MSDMVKALGMALDVAQRPAGEPAPTACCPHDGEPLILTMEYSGAEFICMVCNGLFGYLDPVPGEPTPERLARHAELKALYQADYAARHPNDFPVDLSTVDFDRPPTIHDWARTTIAWTGGVGVTLVDGYRVTRDIEDAVKAAWSSTYNGDIEVLRDRQPDPVGMQQTAAEVARIARENPGKLPACWLAGWQKHAASVARSARTEMCRYLGGTGIELQVIEAGELSFPDAVAWIAMVEAAIAELEADPT